MPVDEYGCFTSEAPDYQGMKVMESNKPITEHLKAAQKIVKTESLVHSYPAEGVKLLLFTKLCRADSSRKKR